MSIDLNHTSFSHKCGWKVKSSDESTLACAGLYYLSSSSALSALVDSSSKYFRNLVFSGHNKTIGGLKAIKRHKIID